jgi:hypothetical protein
LICEVADDMTVADQMLGRRVPTKDHQGLWEADQVCDLVEVHRHQRELRFGSSPGSDM